ncbi:ABC transporter permease subunit [Caldalkalibacillus salinus]|uniref:ABC transporter permease subunit n=1 Tax=Caldalkalibacillus salinus TaxID=2803787 RepID=UPI001921160D|nr:ABC transporter permease subunit [Caldalkalibacillus salinus]
MWSRSLWRQNYKQAKTMIWGFILVSLLLPYNLFQESVSINNEWPKNLDSHHRVSPPPSAYDMSYYFMDTSLILQGMVVIIMASLLLGLQRTNQSYELTLSLPYSRQEIMLSKWLLGVLTIVGSVAVSALLSLIVIQTTILTEYFHLEVLGYYVIFAILGTVAIFSFATMFGYLTGSFFAQAVLTSIFVIFPIPFAELVRTFVSNHTGEFVSMSGFTDSMSLVTLAMYVADFGYRASDAIHREGGLSGIGTVILVCGLYTLLSVALAYILSRHAKAEHHGRTLLYQSIEPILKAGVIVCFFLTGGMFFSEINYHGGERSLVSYYMGGILFAGIAYYVLTKLLNIRFRFQYPTKNHNKKVNATK